MHDSSKDKLQNFLLASYIFTFFYVVFVLFYFVFAPIFGDNGMIACWKTDYCNRIYLLDDARLGEIGDYLTGFFSPLAFYWFVTAVFLQRSEIALQRQSLDLQIKEMENFTKSNMDQANQLKFSNTMAKAGRFFAIKSAIIPEDFRDFVVSRHSLMPNGANINLISYFSMPEHERKGIYRECAARTISDLRKIEKKIIEPTPEQIEIIEGIQELLEFLYNEMSESGLSSYRDNIFRKSQEGEMLVLANEILSSEQ